MTSFFKKLFLRDNGPQFTEQDYEIGNLKNLPIECRKIIHRAGLTPTECNDNYDILLSVLWFEMKKNLQVIQHLKELIQKINKEKYSQKRISSDATVAIVVPAKPTLAISTGKEKLDVEEKRISPPDINKLNVQLSGSGDRPKSIEKSADSGGTTSIPEIFVPEDDDNDLITSPVANSIPENKIKAPHSETKSNSSTEKPQPEKEKKEHKHRRPSRKKNTMQDVESLCKHVDPTTIFPSRNKIGKGGYGEVYTAKDIRNSQTIAIKVMIQTVADDLDGIVNEIKVLASCKHANIVNYIESYYWNDHIWVIMEYCDGGTLNRMISEVELQESQIAYLFKDLLKALTYLHALNIVHRDIKSDNILLNLDGEVKLADLGLCAEIKKGEEKKTMAGSKYWMPPEMIKRDTYNVKADIWSLGCLGFEMVQGFPPYCDYKPVKAMFRIATVGAPTLKQPDKWSQPLKDFLFTKIFLMNPEQRGTAAELLEHPFIQKACKREKLVQAIEIVFLGSSLRMNGF